MKVLVLKNETRTLLPIYVRPHNIKSCNLSTREKEVFGKRKNNLTPQPTAKIRKSKQPWGHFKNHEVLF